MQHALIYILTLALGGLQLTPPQQRFHCRMTGQRDLVQCCCEGRDTDGASVCDFSAGGGDGKACCKSNAPCERDERDENHVVAVSNCCDVTNVAVNTPTVVESSRQNRDVESAANSQPIVIPTVRDDELHGGYTTSGVVVPNRTGSPEVKPPRFILHCAFLI